MSRGGLERLPEPQLLHRSGDWFLGRRLPEFEVVWRDQEHRAHPLTVVGRQVRCGIHDAYRAMPDITKQSPCGTVRRIWPRLFEQGFYIDMMHEWPELGPGRKLRLAALRIQATMIDEVARHATYYSLSHAGTALGTPYWLRFGELMERAPQIGLTDVGWGGVAEY